MVSAIAIDAGHDRSLLVLSNPLLEKVGLTLQRYQLHPIKGVLSIIHLAIPQRPKQPVRHELDVLAHQVAVHAHQGARQRVADELPLDVHRVADDPPDPLLAQLLLHQRVEQAGEVAVEPFVPRDQLVRERQARHEPALLQPEYRAEAPGEEDPLDAGERDQPLRERLRAVDPAEGPLGLPGDAGDGLDGVEEAVLLGRVLDVGLEEEAVHLGVDVLDGDLEAVEGTRLRDLDLLHEPPGEVLQDDAVRGGEEGEHVGDEVLLVGGHRLPLPDVLGEVHLLRRPERGLRLLVHLPDFRVLNWEHAEPIRVRGEEWLFWVSRHFWVGLKRNGGNFLNLGD
ncbi:hypothetical protein TorRG33x02_089040 [Trema orientale]|uniref:Uncharacterized protein n=1 Tax=Trema orientale TaxID=63057 RepID=A0A2P5FC76_TREOI|nr:hypothetical protein TorRG33x02_089040 [Trema orientale]